MSDFLLKNAIVHRLVKEQYKAIQPIVYRPDVLNPSSVVVRDLIQGVLKAYGAKKNRAHYGVFEEGDGNKFFPVYFKTYYDYASVDDQQFMTLCKGAMRQLYVKAESVPFASGGYVLFADYVHGGIRFFLVAMIKETAGISISDDLEPEALIRLDLDRLHQAARINFSKYTDFFSEKDPELQSQINYLSFISSGSSGSASGYFVTALGCSRGTTSDRATKTLIQESVQYFRGHPDLKHKKNDFKRSLIEYLNEKEKSGESVRLSEVGLIVSANIPSALGDQADDIVEDLIASLNNEKNAVPVEFPLSSRELKKQTHIKLDADNWKAEFDRKLLGTDESAPVYYNQKLKNITFNKIPTSMIKIIEEEILDKLPEKK
ncbi:nucleoid-associated protein [Cellvibrio mixtus]|uniref:nucleoid-associated protein n=1 Tax=Cellvibrio mixtus TaxID=39650 RepID=UPI001482B5A5|nr:nucleoid-associated protein [Cellvibrio mixtus]